MRAHGIIVKYGSMRPSTVYCSHKELRSVTVSSSAVKYQQWTCEKKLQSPSPSAFYMGKYSSFVYSMYVMYVSQVKIIFRLFYF